MENKKNNIIFSSERIVTKIPTCCLIEDYWMLKSALDSIAEGAISDAISSIRCAMECISDTINDCTEVAPDLDISPSISSAIAMACDNGIILEGKRDLRCAAGYALSDAGCQQCDDCEFRGECDPEEGSYLLKGNVLYQPWLNDGGESFVSDLEENYPRDADEHPLTAIQTPFGTIFIEDGDPDKREEWDRLKIYDSEKRYFEYIEIYSDEGADYEAVLDDLRHMVTVFELLSYVGFSSGYYLASCCEEASYILADEEFRYYSPEALLENEWVNKFGDTYVLFKS